MEIPEFCSAIEIWIFWEILEFSKLKSIILFIIREISMKYNLKFYFNFENQVLSAKFKMQLPRRILVFPEILIKLQCKKKFDCISDAHLEPCLNTLGLGGEDVTLEWCSSELPFAAG